MGNMIFSSQDEFESWRALIVSRGLLDSMPIKGVCAVIVYVIRGSVDRSSLY